MEAIFKFINLLLNFTVAEPSFAKLTNFLKMVNSLKISEYNVGNVLLQINWEQKKLFVKMISKINVFYIVIFIQKTKNDIYKVYFI